jgi:hypothetical protein
MGVESNLPTVNMKHKAETGMKFGQITLIEFSHFKYTKNGKFIKRQPYWLCKCDCGKQKFIRIENLYQGTKSCGCARNATLKTNSQNIAMRKLAISRNDFSYIKRLFYSYQSMSARTNKSFSLDFEKFAKIIFLNCNYCGISPSNTLCWNRNDFKYNGIDRVDSSIGYQDDNIVPCCKNCNFAKRKMTIVEFKQWLCRIFSHYKKELSL